MFATDFAHLIWKSRAAGRWGVPARYVSGYLYVAGVEGLRGEQATHAWVECLLPSGRWLGVDPTNDVLVNDRYIAVHSGRDYSDVTPTRGVYIGTPAKSLDVSVQVDRVDVGSSSGFQRQFSQKRYRSHSQAEVTDEGYDLAEGVLLNLLGSHTAKGALLYAKFPNCLRPKIC